MAINGLADAKANAAAMFVHFSDVAQKEITDKEGNLLGTIWDISLKLDEVYPKLGELIIKKGFIKRSYAVVPWSKVSNMDDDIVLDLSSSDLKFIPVAKDYDFLLKRDVLDQQVVDTYNHKVRRVNDIHLLRVDHEFVVAHVDIGIRSLIRRLGWEKGVDFIVRMINKRSKYLTTEELVSWKYVQPVSVNPASMTMKLSIPQKQLQSIPAADLSEIIFDLNPNQRMALFSTLDIKTKAKILESLEYEDQKAMVRSLDKKDLAQILSHMSSDEATDLLERLPQSTVKNLLTLIESNRAKKLSTLLGYSSDSAGGLMTTEFVSMPETMTIETAIEYIKKQTQEYEIVPYIYIVDDKNRLKGVTTVRRLLLEDPKETVLRTAFPKTVHVYLNKSVKEVAYFMDKYKLSAIPVIDEDKVMHGIITVDDILGQVISIAWRKRSKTAKGLYYE